MQYGRRAQGAKSSLRAALAQCKGWLIAVAIFSAVINILYLTASIYMLQVYDRVLTSRSVPTLVGISLIAFAAYALQGVLDGLRGRMLARIGIRFDELMLGEIYRVVVSLPLRGVRPSDAVRPVRDLDQVRQFLSGMGPAALFDIPFMPLFLLVAFLLHPALGWLTLAGGAAILGLTLLTEYKSQEPARALAEEAATRNGMVEGVCRNAESLFALGMRSNLEQRFAASSARQNTAGLSGSDVTSGIGAIAKILRMTLQSASLGLGAYLVIYGEMSAGAIIAASIVTSRALAPIETAVAHWRGFVAARQGYARLKEVLEKIPAEPARMSLPAPHSTLQVENIVAFAPGRGEPVLTGISLSLRAGESLGVIGPSGGGKSTLARTMVGIWPVAKGQITLDGAALNQWNEDLGRHVGYLSQTMELFDGTVAENISRFAPDWTSEAVIAAAKAAGAHDMIVDLAQGYDTVIGEGGSGLSGGQRQRIALARALYGDPFLVVLDEPNANLDRDGDAALTQAIRSITARGGIAVIITHRPTGLAAVERVAIIQNGRITKLGPRDEVLSSVAGPPANARPPGKPSHVRLAVDPRVEGGVS